MSVHLSGRRGPAALAVASVAALGLSLVSVPAHAAETSITLLNINDWHGRIDANTVKFAGTIESLRAAAGEENTLFLSDGDNIGASLFASASAEDQPTLDVLNALGLQASWKLAW